jgi:hypothetical protein
MCKENGCKVQPIYNKEGESKALYCSTHKQEGMVDVKHKKCIYQNCKVQPTYNKEGESKALYCSSHKQEDMVNVRDKTCKTYLCSIRVGDKYDGYCLFCFMNMFPDKPVSRNYKTKEYAVIESIKTKFSDLKWISDKMVQDGCSKRRPDLLLDLCYQILIVEVDENQHIDYDCSCENKRIMEISQDVGHRPIIFIRFNPDEYKENNGEIIKSCWANDKKGICKVKTKKQTEWNDRLNRLHTEIEYWIQPTNMTDKMVEIIQLYYDK